jgi:hypothetical protein
MGLLNGEFSIKDENTDSDTRIFVEEYKRPKFLVEVAPPKGTYRVNDSVKVEGNAKSYAGNSINGATVNYRVFRSANIPMWYTDYMPRIWPPYPQQEKVIIYGTTTTDENGKFIITFPALPDNSIPRSAHPVFNYSVYADVTDINGETISSNTRVNVSYESMKLVLDLPSRIHTDSLKNLTVRSTNMNDSFEKAGVKLALYKLNAPSKIFRDRYWEQPDQFVMSRDEYYASFPLDLYSDENNKVKWTKGNPIAEISGTTSADGEFKDPGKIAEPGWYLIEASTKDKYGDSVQDKKYVLLYNDKIVSPESVAMLNADKTDVQPGEKVKYDLKSNIGEVNVIHEVVKNKNAKTDLINTSKNEIGTVLNISESDRGSIIVKVAFVKNNRFYTDNLTIGVPFKNKELKIDYITFRDKTLPGSDEKWKVKVSGLKGDKVAAELLTSMYDASLDELHKHQWALPNIWSMENDYSAWNGKTDFFAGESDQRNNYEEEENPVTKEYDRLKTTEEQVFYARDSKLYGARAPSVAANGMMRTLQGKVQGIAIVTEAAANQSNEIYDTALDQTYNKNLPPPSIQPRKNLNETAFFFPDLKTDSSGNVEFSFTSPEALTKWNWRMIAHTRYLAFGFGEKSVVTQKQLMVQPNAPRFLREGDSIDFSVKVANMSAQAISGLASLQLFDPSTGKEVTGMINKIHQSIKFNAPSGQSVPLSFTIKIPTTYAQPLTWRVIATAGTKDASLSDGEEDIIPVLSNRMLVTETITLPVRGQNTKSFKFEKLLKSGTGTSLKNKALTIEFTSNPAWYAVQALPYLLEAKDENAEQIFNRYYANALASNLANSFPKLKSIIEKWKNSDTSAFLSNLQKNQDLKNILLEETPWVLEAKTESQQKKNIALLFDVVRMSQELKSALDKLNEMQTESGAFTWNKGGYPDRYMTQYIISGMGKLKKLGAIPTSDLAKINILTSQAIAYLDNEIKRDYALLKKNNKKLPNTYIGYDPIHYLYMRSFFTDIAVPGDVFNAYNYFRNQVKQGWVKQNTYMRAMIALSLQRTGDPQTAKKIIAALKESSISNEEMGMYWKDMNGGYYWYQAPVETQSVLIEAFSEIAGDNNAIADLKTWLLRNKQTNNWKTSKATADACYALLLQGENWLSDETPVNIQLGEKTISSPAHAEAGTGYFRTSIPVDSIKPSMGNVTVNLQSNSHSQPSWGGVYWQYFEDLDKITSAATALKIEKEIIRTEKYRPWTRYRSDR